MSVSEHQKRQFEEIDIDGDGFITADELKISLQSDGNKISDDNAAVIVQMADDNGDRRIDLEEYAKITR